MLESASELPPTVASLSNYLTGVLHMDAGLERWADARLPVFMTLRYTFHRGVIAGQPCLFMAAKTDSDPSPADIGKHVGLLAPDFDGLVVYVAAQMNATVRSRLIAQGTAFTVPKNQLYIPQLAMDLREHFRARSKRRGAHLAPAAQLVLFHHILRGGHAPVTPSALADPLGLTAMSIGRAFDQLAQVDLATVERLGRQKLLRFTTDRLDLRDLSRTLLKSPVASTHGVVFKTKRPPMPRAGETALAELTPLAPPDRATYAILSMGWQAFFRENDIEDVNDTDAAEAFIEIWRYDPNVLSADGSVDPLSLHAQFWDHSDERLAQAAAQLLDTLR